LHREIKNLRIIVTGGSGGIGRSIASALVQAEARVCNFARRAENLANWADEHSANAPNVTTFVGDVTKPEDRSGVVAHTVQKFGGLDCVVNNAGVGAIGRFAESTPDLLQKVLDVNFHGAVEMTRVALPHLACGTTPIVVNIGSILGHRAIPQYSEYCASKFALRGWSESIRSEFSKLGIDVLLVSPGTTSSEFWDHTLSDQHSPPWANSKPVPSEKVAKSILNAMRKGKHEIIPHGRGRLFILANKFVPRVITRVMNKWG
jgi:short-subunit dehydrogenase